MHGFFYLKHIEMSIRNQLEGKHKWPWKDILFNRSGNLSSFMYASGFDTKSIGSQPWPHNCHVSIYTSPHSRLTAEGRLKKQVIVARNLSSRPVWKTWYAAVCVIERIFCLFIFRCATWTTYTQAVHQTLILPINPALPNCKIRRVGVTNWHPQHRATGLCELAKYRSAQTNFYILLGMSQSIS